MILIPGDECGLNFLAFVLRLRENPGKNLNQEIDPTGDRTKACCVRNNDVTPRPQAVVVPTLCTDVLYIGMEQCFFLSVIFISDNGTAIFFTK